ncbi:MAG: DUF3987 domain-containing protein [Acidobacteriota bacterium]|nr:DUF3987 domain-containing protein [Acidobacteriota bacterium]
MSRLLNVARLASVQEEEATEGEVPLSEPWPSPADEVFHGLAGRYVRKIEPHTEADPIGILIQLMVLFGNLLGRGPHFRVEADEHHLNLFVVLVGQSSKGRKGVSAGQARRLFHNIDSDWCTRRIEQGLSSGEGLIWAVRDPIEKVEAVRENGRPTGEIETVVTDAGEDDKRLFVQESEFASTLRVLKRDGNTLSAIVRNAWDSGKLSSLTKNSPARATGAHISIVGHITKQELLRYLDSTEAANGFGNRFLWCCVRRSKLLPEGGQAHTLDFREEIRELEEVLAFSRQVSVLRRDANATRMWAEVYPELSEGKPGMLGSMIGRAEAQTMRLACLYALLDRSDVVRSEHLFAALALWQYCEDSARWIFGDALGDPVADQILRFLRRNPEGLTRTEIGNLFGRHCKKGDLSRGLGLLLEQGLAKAEKLETGGRPTESWKATSLTCEKSEESE